MYHMNVSGKNGVVLLNASKNSLRQKVRPYLLYIIGIILIASVFSSTYALMPLQALLALIICCLVIYIFVNHAKGKTSASRTVESHTAALEHAHQELEEHYHLLQKMNVDLEASKVKAETANRSKSEFLATMSHELRTPLNAILGYSEIIRGEAIGKISEPRYLEYADDIYQSGDHLLALINDMLDLAKLEAGTVKFEFEPVSPERLCEGIIKMLKHTTDEKGLRIITEINPSLPLILLGDRLRLKQILINLITNAVKFTESGTITIGLDTKEYNDGRSGFILEVIDTGIGIPEQKQENLFERFVQADNELSRSHEGAGLGLAICKELARQMDGEIYVESKLGHGSKFWVHLPLLDVNDMDDQLQSNNMI